jgi:hypothetical protein
LLLQLLHMRELPAQLLYILQDPLVIKVWQHATELLCGAQFGLYVCMRRVQQVLHCQLAGMSSSGTDGWAVALLDVSCLRSHSSRCNISSAMVSSRCASAAAVPAGISHSVRPPSQIHQITLIARTQTT